MKKQKRSRRYFIKQAALAGLGGMVLPGIIKAGNIFPHNTQFTLPVLPYTYDTFEPHIDKLTMEIHHSKHHQAYVNNLNKALAEMNTGHVTLEQLCENASAYGAAIRNNAGGHYNHTLFWTLMKPAGGGEPGGAVGDAIKNTFDSFDKFKTRFNEAAIKIFGSGWAWLVMDKNKKLQIGITPNQDNPLMDVSGLQGRPLLALDVWEHAYYLKHQNKRADYINAWWNVVNWEKVNELFASM